MNQTLTDSFNLISRIRMIYRQYIDKKRNPLRTSKVKLIATMKINQEVTLDMRNR